jgi:hypothetical protein
MVAENMRKTRETFTRRNALSRTVAPRANFVQKTSDIWENPDGQDYKSAQRRRKKKKKKRSIMRNNEQ